MFLRPDCIPCILQMTISSINKLALDERSIKKLYTEILDIPALRGRCWETTSAEVIEDIWRKIVKRIGSPDIFGFEKSNQNKKIMDMYPVLEKMVHKARDPLYMAVKLSILGNSMDLMIADSSLKVEKSIADRVKLPLSDEKLFKVQKAATSNPASFDFRRQHRRNCVR